MTEQKASTLHVADNPMSQAIAKAAALRGITSNIELADAVDVDDETARSWTGGRHMPRFKSFIKIVEGLNPDDNPDVREMLMTPYRPILAQAINRPRNVPEKRESTINAAKKRRKETSSPLGQWFYEYVDRNATTLSEVGKKIDTHINSTEFKQMTPAQVCVVFDRVAEKLDLSVQEQDQFIYAATEEVETKVAQGKSIEHRLRGTHILYLQKRRPDVTYTGTEVAKMIGKKRQNVFLHKKQLGITDLLMTPDQAGAIVIYDKLPDRYERSEFAQNYRRQQAEQSA
ncbi:MAG TPA: hypothetical protein VLF68_04220 [Candidatus Saccharimonadales bacterium]|nr:hypothetical protein [Candidatus Saccharimonadales bacterium]